MTAPTIPNSTRRGLVTGAALMVIIAAAVNVSHTRRNALDQGADPWTATVIGVLPDVMLVLSVMRLRYHRRSGWAWIGVAASVLLVAWSALETAGAHGPRGWIIALVCVTFAVIATGQAHIPGGERLEVLTAHLEAFTEDAQRTLCVEREVNASEHAAAVEAEQRAARETERVRAELANMTAERDRLRAEHSAANMANADPNGRGERRLRTVPNTATGQRERSRPTDEESVDAFAAWVAREGTEAPMTSRELAGLLGTSVDAARVRANRWRRKANNPEAANSEAAQ